MNASLTLGVIIALLVAVAFAAYPSEPMQRVRRVLLGGVVLLLVLGFLGRFRALLPPFVVPLLLAYLLDPLLDAMERRGYTRVRAILVVYGVTLLLFLLAGIIVVPVLIRQIGGIIEPLARGDAIDLAALGQWVEFPDKLLKGIEKTLLDWGVREQWVASLAENLNAYRVEEWLQAAGLWVVEQLKSLVGWLRDQVSGLLWLVLLPITLFYCLRDFDPLRRRLYHLVPADRQADVAALAGKINQAVGSYLRGYALLSVAVAILQTTLLLILAAFFDFRYALILGLLAGATYVIPYVGSMVSTVLTAAVVFFTGGHSVVEALVVWAICQGLNSVFDNVITPRVIGQNVGLHPLVVMFALLAGGSQFGLLGVILATPVTACAKIVLQHFWPRLSEPLPSEAQPPASDDAADQAAEPEEADHDRGPDPPPVP